MRLPVRQVACLRYHGAIVSACHAEPIVGKFQGRGGGRGHGIEGRGRLLYPFWRGQSLLGG